jgi:bla regulator protein blaR1
MTVDALTYAWATTAWQATAVAVAALLFTLVARRAPAGLRHAALAVALVKFVVPPFAYAPTGIFGVVPQAFSSAAVTEAAPANIASATDPLLPMLVLATALSGALIVFAAALFSTIRIGRMRRRGHRSAVLNRIAADLAVSLGLRRRVEVVVVPDLGGPLAVGIFRPAILIPASLVETLAHAELRAVVAHELAHHRRGHLVWA